MKKRLFSMLIVLIVLISALPVSARELPKSINIDGEVFIIDRKAGDRKNTATPDNIIRVMGSSYEVTDSDVSLYTRRTRQFSYGWVVATAPNFTARAEVWVNGKVLVTGPNTSNDRRNIAEAKSHECRVNEDAVPRIFYSFK